MQKRKNDDNKEPQPASKQFQYSHFVSAGSSNDTETNKPQRAQVILTRNKFEDFENRMIPSFCLKLFKSLSLCDSVYLCHFFGYATKYVLRQKIILP